MIPNCWQKPHELKLLEGELRDKLAFCEIGAIKKKYEKITADLVNLAHNRESEIRGR